MDDSVTAKYNNTISKLEALKLRYATKMTETKPAKEDATGKKMRASSTNYAAKVIACEMVLSRMRPKPQRIKNDDYDPHHPDLRAYNGFQCQYCAGPGPQRYPCACASIQDGSYNDDNECDDYYECT